MSFDRIVKAIIKDAMERGEFDQLSGRGRPINLTEYFETPEEVRSAILDEKKKAVIERKIQQKHVEFSLIMERQR
jgi:hypothetical protein